MADIIKLKETPKINLRSLSYWVNQPFISAQYYYVRCL
jgi:hypothetical protein